MTNGTDNHQLEEQIRAFVAANLLYSPDGFAYADDASFLQEGIIDSLGVMHLVEFVVHNCGIAVAQQEVTPENFDSVARLAGFIRRKRQGQATSP
jgi:acyl carrier protein